MKLQPLEGELAVCRLESHEAVPSWAAGGPLVAVTRTAEELSIVCAAAGVPEGVRAERGWRALCVAGTLDFALVGVLAGLTAPLAQAGISVFAVSTFDTDYLLVKQERFEEALRILERQEPQ
ncbi:MAG: ACT domain-containing protein [Acidobacteria bacterium]|nr:ACT domain-containing protein [Acidobacteriota bacterium]